MSKNPVRIDGKAVKPILDRSNYVKVSVQGIQLIEVSERLEACTSLGARSCEISQSQRLSCFAPYVSPCKAVA